MGKPQGVPHPGSRAAESVRRVRPRVVVKTVIPMEAYRNEEVHDEDNHVNSGAGGDEAKVLSSYDRAARLHGTEARNLTTRELNGAAATVTHCTGLP